MRSHFLDYFLGHINSYERLYKFGKLKGWSDVEPAFKTSKPTDREPISVSEATHLWDHLNRRYDQMQLNAFYVSFVHDREFMLILKKGLSTLKKQAKLLEDECVRFAVPLPARPPSSQEAAIDPETLEDQFCIYRINLAGLQSAIQLHTRAVLETIRNDSVRALFYEFLVSEINMYNKFIKYGKAKGWLHIVPMYRPTA